MLPSVIVLGVLLTFAITGIYFLIWKQRQNVHSKNMHTDVETRQDTEGREVANNTSSVSEMETEPWYFELHSRAPQDQLTLYQELHYASPNYQNVDDAHTKHSPVYQNMGDKKPQTTESPEYQNMCDKKHQTTESPEYQNMCDKKPQTTESPEYQNMCDKKPQTSHSPEYQNVCDK